MGATKVRTTVYFKAGVHEMLRVKAGMTGRSVSDLVNMAVREALREDEEDLRAIEERAGEETISFEELIESLKGV